MSSDFWAGYLSGAAGIIIGNPLDLIKVRLQASPSIASTPTPASPRSLVAGLPAPVLTYGGLNALLFLTYNRTLALLPTTAPRLHPPWTHFTAGSLAGLATFVISAPTELIKCRAQLAPSSSPTTSWSIAKTTWQTDGLRGLYHGGLITSIRDAVGYGFYFWTYEVSKTAYENHFPAQQNSLKGSIGYGAGEGPHSEALKVLLCGGLAGVATWASIFPLDVIKTRVQTQPLSSSASTATASSTGRLAHGRECTNLLGQTISSTAGSAKLRDSAWTVARQAYKHEGAGVFFRGLTVCCVRAFIVNAVQWTVYEWMMRYLMTETNRLPM